MTYTERDILLGSEEYVGRCRIALSDWVNYWAVNGTASIEDAHLREMTDTFLRVYLDNPEAYTQKIIVLAIAQPTVKDAVEVTDIGVKTAVDQLMANALSYLL